MRCIRASASEYWLGQHTGNDNCPICKNIIHIRKKTMSSNFKQDTMMVEELRELLSLLPPGTIMHLGPIPEENTIPALTILMWCIKPEDNSIDKWIEQKNIEREALAETNRLKAKAKDEIEELLKTIPKGKIIEILTRILEQKQT